MAKVCMEPGCPVIAAEAGRCPGHHAEYRQRYAERQRDYDRSRGNRHARGYDARWTKAAHEFLIAHPRCGCGAPSGHVDHVVPHQGDQELFWDRSNWQALCQSCHNRKTGSERRAARRLRSATGRPFPPVGVSD